MREYETHLPDGVRDGAPLIVLLHGRGANERDLMGLLPRLPQDWIALFPRATFPGAPWGYGPGWAWYRYLGGTSPEPESFSMSLDALGTLLDTFPERVGARPGPLILGGFSQGGTMSTAFALANPGRVAMVLNFSGFLADHPAIQVTEENASALRLFWGHGLSDPAIPHAFAVEGRAALREAGADLEARDYPIGHWIDPAELADAVKWVQAGLAEREAR